MSLPRLDVVVLRIVERVLEEERVDREWLLDLLWEERVRLLAGAAETAGEEVLEELAGRWTEGGGWAADLEAFGYEIHAGRAALAVLERLHVGENLPVRVAEALAEGAAAGVSPAGGIALLARLSTSEHQTVRWTTRFLDELAKRGVRLDVPDEG